MGELKSYETFALGNVDENEIVKIKIFSHTPIDELTIKQINKTPCYKVQRMAKMMKWKVMILDN